MLAKDATEYPDVAAAAVSCRSVAANLRRKQGIRRYAVLHQFDLVVIPLDSVGGNHSQEQRLARSGYPAKRLYLIAQFSGIFLVDHEFVLAELHLAQVDYPVSSIDYQIDLRPSIRRVHGRVPPR